MEGLCSDLQWPYFVIWCDGEVGSALKYREVFQRN